MRASSNGRGKPNGNGHNDGETPSERPKRRPVRAILKDGLEAALRADPEVLTNCKPKTGAGMLVRALVLEAGKGKMTAFKQLMSIVDGKADAGESEESQGDADEPSWDWSRDGVWQTQPQAETGEARDSEDDGPARREVLRRLARLIEGDEADRARAVRIIEALRTDNFEHSNGGGTEASAS